MTTIEDIKDRLDIVEVVGSYVELKKAGRDFNALCPFHADKKTRSFVVFSDSQRWQCFGACNEGGDVFDFVMKREGWNFHEAMVDLAKRAGVELPRWSEKAQKAVEAQRGREAIFGVAARFWQEALAGSEGEEYALGRGWSAETITAAGLGYWSGDQVGLRKALVSAGVDMKAGAVQAVLGAPARSLIYPHVRAKRVSYFAARGVRGKAHWNPPREAIGARQPYFNWLWRRDAEKVIVIEGQGDGVTLGQWGMAAVALAGAGASEKLVKVLQQHKAVYVALDEDPTGHEATRNLATALGPLVRVVTWPAHDANDWLKEGGTAEECQKLLDKAPTWLSVLIKKARGAEIEDENVRAVFAAMVGLDAFAAARYRGVVADELDIGLATIDGLLKAAREAAGLDGAGQALYQVMGGQICRRSFNRAGIEVVTPLCNFEAHIVEDVVEDDGEDQERRFVLEGILAGGHPLPAVDVEAVEFGKMTWVLPMWGARAAVAAGAATRDHLRMALQFLSTEIQTRYEYAHLGWRKVSGKRVYLSSAGAVGMEEVQVRVIQDLAAYQLPTWPGEDRERAMRASVAFLETGDYQVTVPLWAAMYLAPLSSIVPPSFTIWLFGTTGTMKSTMTALALCHYGKFSYNTPPASWTGTTNALEKKAFLTKDAPLWIDDYTAQSTIHGMNEIKKKADQLLRDWGNRSGRSRMRADLKLRRTFVPRGLIISTAEQLPPGQSILSRLFAIEVHPEMVQGGEGSNLTKAQLEESQLYPQAMAGYVTWLAERWEELKRELPERRLELMEKARSAGQHLRMPGNVATVYLGLEMGLRYAREVGAVDESMATALKETGWALLIGIGEQQHQATKEEKPVELYLNALQQMFAQGVIFLRDKRIHDEGGAELVWPEGRVVTAEMLGWYDETFCYLLPDVAYKSVQRFYQASGRVFPDSERGVRVKLDEQEKLLCQADRKTYILRIGESRHRVLRMYRQHLLGELPGDENEQTDELPDAD